jgi:hypothetical protein
MSPFKMDIKIDDTTHFPFDTQKCSIMLIAWPYTSSDIYFISMFATAQTEFLMEDVTWELDYTAVTIR